jgi:hypothetical protein
MFPEMTFSSRSLPSRSCESFGILASRKEALSPDGREQSLCGDIQGLIEPRSWSNTILKPRLTVSLKYGDSDVPPPSARSHGDGVAGTEQRQVNGALADRKSVDSELIEKCG